MPDLPRASRRPGTSVVVMPVYNEEATLCAVLDAVRLWFVEAVIVVDDGSTDGTSECLAARADVEVVRHESNLGYGASLIDGFAAARGLGAERVVTMDCDGQHEPAHIPTFLKALDQADVASGSRYLPGSAVVGSAPPDRVGVNAAITREVNRVTGWHITDAFCGFKAYRASALDRLELSEAGYAMPLELWAKAWAIGLRITELPVERIYYDHDRSFGADLDDTDKRLSYYMRVWRDALAESVRRPREEIA